MPAPAEAQTNACQERIDFINETGRQLHKAVVTLVDAASDAPPGTGKAIGTILEPALALLVCGLAALTEIADAQQRMATLSELDVAAEIKSAAEAGAVAIAEDMQKETMKRNFIGNKT